MREIEEETGLSGLNREDLIHLSKRPSSDIINGGDYINNE